MVRKLKTYITNLGFFELALAAPSMKAALEAWGLGHNAFHQGFAKETHDTKIVAAAMAKPGVVLKRPVGSKGAFVENAKLPKDWSLAADSKLPAPKAKKRAKTKPEAPHAKTKAQAGKADKAERAAIISFEKEKARREREREKQAARDDARAAKEQARRQRDVSEAETALERAQARHEDAMAALEKERDKLDRRAMLEKERWEEERDALKADLRKARK